MSSRKFVASHQVQSERNVAPGHTRGRVCSPTSEFGLKSDAVPPLPFSVSCHQLESTALILLRLRRAGVIRG